MEHVAHQLNLCRDVSRFRPSRRTPGTFCPYVMCTLLWCSWSRTLIDDFISHLINSSSRGFLISSTQQPSWICCAPLRGVTLALWSFLCLIINRLHHRVNILVLTISCAVLHSCDLASKPHSATIFESFFVPVLMWTWSWQTALLVGVIAAPSEGG